MSGMVTVRARLKGELADMQKLHDEVIGATQEMAKRAGDISHVALLGPPDGNEILVIDEWESAEVVEAFVGDPQIQEFFGNLFDGPPEIRVWQNQGWNQW